MGLLDAMLSVDSYFRDKKSKKELSQRQQTLDDKITQLRHTERLTDLPSDWRVLEPLFDRLLEDGNHKNAFVVAQKLADAKINQTHLAWCYFKGIGTGVDIARARALQEAECSKENCHIDIIWPEWWGLQKTGYAGQNVYMFIDLEVMHRVFEGRLKEYKGSVMDMVYLLDVMIAERGGLPPLDPTPEQVQSFYQNLADKAHDPGKKHHSYAQWHLHRNDKIWGKATDAEILEIAGPLPWMYMNGQFCRDREALERQRKEDLAPFEAMGKDIYLSFEQIMERLNDQASVLCGDLHELEEMKALYENGTPQEKDQALARIRQMIQSGSIAAKVWLMERQAEEGIPEAITELGNAYRRGPEGFPKNERRAVELFQEAARYNECGAIYALAVCYRYGECGQPKDLVKAEHLYQDAADLGHVDACIYMAEKYLASDYPRAKAYLFTAMDKGSAQACRLWVTSKPVSEMILAADDYDFSLDKAIRAAVTAAIGQCPNIQEESGGSAWMLMHLYSKFCDEMKQKNWFTQSDEIILHALVLNALLHCQHDHSSGDNSLTIAGLYSRLGNNRKNREWHIRALERGDELALMDAVKHPENYDMDEDDRTVLLRDQSRKGGDIGAFARGVLQQEHEAVAAKARADAFSRSAETESRLDAIERDANALVNGQYYTEEERLIQGQISKEEYAKSAFLRDSAREAIKKKESE